MFQYLLNNLLISTILVFTFSVVVDLDCPQLFLSTSLIELEVSTEPGFLVPGFPGTRDK